ncbi:MAG: hypothetical protein PHQ23_08445 [Candidatus Wallbacteria bacterium]|nr:hypothetical protein [Candidatus Wallbacteria bacterium]
MSKFKLFSLLLVFLVSTSLLAGNAPQGTFWRCTAVLADSSVLFDPSTEPGKEPPGQVESYWKFSKEEASLDCKVRLSKALGFKSVQEFLEKVDVEKAYGLNFEARELNPQKGKSSFKGQTAVYQHEKGLSEAVDEMQILILGFMSHKIDQAALDKGIEALKSQVKPILDGIQAAFEKGDLQELKKFADYYNQKSFVIIRQYLDTLLVDDLKQYLIDKSAKWQDYLVDSVLDADQMDEID